MRQMVAAAAVVSIVLASCGHGLLSAPSQVDQEEQLMRQTFYYLARKCYQEEVDLAQAIDGAISGLQAQTDRVLIDFDRDQHKIAVQTDASRVEISVPQELTHPRTAEILGQLLVEVGKSAPPTQREALLYAALKGVLSSLESSAFIVPPGAASPAPGHAESTLSPREAVTTRPADRLLPVMVAPIDLAVNTQSGEVVHRVLYLRVHEIGSGIHEIVKGAIETIGKESKPIAALLLDLRICAGGLLDQCVALADTLMDRGRIGAFRERTGKLIKVEAHADTTLTRVPVIVLQSEFTAAGAELVAVALRESVALTIGRKSFGRGYIQKIFPLAAGARLGLTVSEMLTPSGTPIEAEGVQQHIELRPSVGIPLGEYWLASVPWQDDSRREQEAPWAQVLFAPSGTFLGGPTVPARPAAENSDAWITSDGEVQFALRILSRALPEPATGSGPDGLLQAALEVLSELPKQGQSSPYIEAARHFMPRPAESFRGASLCCWTAW